MPYMYLSRRLHKKIEEYFPYHETLGKTFTYRQITKKMNNILHPLGAKAKIIKDKDFKTSRNSIQYYSFSGCYYPDAVGVPIVITLHMSPGHNCFKFNKSNYHQFMFMFSQVVQHEFIHKSQYMFRPDHSEKKIKIHFSKKIPKNQLRRINYLSTWCEVEAYAHDIAMEINHFYPNASPSVVLKNINKHRKLYSFSLYKNAFKGTNWDKLRKSLILKIWRWLPCAHGPMFALDKPLIHR
jgi:hypothetical protein